MAKPTDVAWEEVVEEARTYTAEVLHVGEVAPPVNQARLYPTPERLYPTGDAENVLRVKIDMLERENHQLESAMKLVLRSQEGWKCRLHYDWLEKIEPDEYALHVKGVLNGIEYSVTVKES